MRRPSPRPPEDFQEVFDRALDVIHFALVSRYRLTEDEARGAEEDLRTWFRRLRRRGAAGHGTPKLLRMSLFSAACQYGRSFQLWKLGGKTSSDADFNGLLSLEPDEVAADLERRFEEELS